MKAIKVIIYGKVQGVGFRNFIFLHAKKLNVKPRDVALEIAKERVLKAMSKNS